MTGLSLNAKRDMAAGKVSFEHWPHFNEHQKVDAAYFADGAENCLEQYPPALDIRANEESTDLILRVSIGQALGDNTDGPAWEMSFKDALTVEWYDDKEDVEATLKVLEALIEHIKAGIPMLDELEKMRLERIL
jgi:hypothetical protein